MKIKINRFTELPPDKKEWAIRRRAEVAKEVAPILGDLAAVGYIAEELLDLRSNPVRDERALDVVVRHLQMSYSPLVEAGFGVNEVEEVVGVAEDMSLDATRTFCFPVIAAGASSELWLSIFMDDEDLPDLSVFGPKGVIERLSFEPDD